MVISHEKHSSCTLNDIAIPTLNAAHRCDYMERSYVASATASAVGGFQAVSIGRLLFDLLLLCFKLI